MEGHMQAPTEPVIKNWAELRMNPSANIELVEEYKKKVAKGFNLEPKVGFLMWKFYFFIIFICSFALRLDKKVIISATSKSPELVWIFGFKLNYFWNLYKLLIKFKRKNKHGAHTNAWKESAVSLFSSTSCQGSLLQIDRQTPSYLLQQEKRPSNFFSK